MLKRTRSLKARLSRVVVLAVLIGILFSVSFFLLNEFQLTVAAEQARLRSSATAFAAAAAKPIRNHDERGTLLVLRGIRGLPEFHYAAARAPDGSTIAEIGQTEMLEGRDGTVDATGPVAMLFAETLSVSAEVRDGGEVVGSVTLTAGIDALRQRYLDALFVSLLFALGLMVITSLIARGVIARIISPLSNLASEFADIGKRSDLTRRLSVGRQDEVGVLIAAFNEMFAHIEQRDTQLQRHRDTLEQTVEERTAQLRVAKDDAERANAAKSDFLATMSHEIRTPMNGMMVMAEMLSAAPLAPRHLRYAEIISRSGRSLLTIINDILDLSKIEAGGLTLEAIPFAIDAIVEDTASLFAERAREKGLTIALHVAPELPRTLIGDPTRLSQVLGNLVNNALKFTHAGGVSIEVAHGTGCSTAGAACLSFQVRDTGIGIAANKLEQIFERFSQADQTITRKFGGTGLGLSISRQLVAAMGGALSVASEEGRGSVFSFVLTLPVAEAAAEPTCLEGRRVAVCAADPLIQAAVTEALARRGAAMVGEQDRPDAVLLQAGVVPPAALPRDVPLVLLRPFAVSGACPEQLTAAGEITLPLSRADVEAFAQALHAGDWHTFQARHQGQQTAATLPDHSHLRVLAVDDTAVNREVLAEALRGFGIQAQLADSGTAAIALAREQSFDVIFMDCSMPDMDGFTATALIRQQEQATRRRRAVVVALTAHVTGPDATRWRAAGMDAYVAKPFTIAQLLAVLGSTAVPDAADHTAAAGQGAEAMPARPAPDCQHVPVLAPETLAMFSSLSVGMSHTIAAKVFGLFRSHVPKAYAQLAAGVNLPADDAASLAHALKSMCLSAGASRAAAICQALEDALKAGARPHALELEELQAALQATEEAMAAALQPASAPAQPQVA